MHDIAIIGLGPTGATLARLLDKKYNVIAIDRKNAKFNSPFYSCIFDKEITDSYCWTISKDNCFIIGGAFPIKILKS